MARREGSFLVEDYYLNIGGLNTADSPFVVEPNQATDGKNFDYVRRGGIRKRAGHTKRNSTPDTQLKTRGLHLWDVPGQTRLVTRCAGAKIQDFDTASSIFTVLSDDSATPVSDLLDANSVQPTVSSMFNTSDAGVLWIAGGGQSEGFLYGRYSSTKVTANGVTVPTGAITLSQTGSGASFVLNSYYRYSVAYIKASTGASSNAVLFKEIQTTSATQKVRINISALTNVDATKYSHILIYRSASSTSAQGNTAYTVGDLVSTVAISAFSSPGYVDDDGSYESTAEVVPMSGNVLMDNTVLPTGSAYKVLTTFKRRLVTASGSNLYISDTNKPESWPLHNYITIPSGGDIVGLGVVSSSSPVSSDIDEYLLVFKQNEVWVVTGSGDIVDGFIDWSLKFLDNSGCAAQSLVVQANGFIFWIGVRGVFMWGGSGKPTYLSRLIEDKFQYNGDIDKSKLLQGYGFLYQSRNEIQWVLSSASQGTQKLVLKLDLRLTLQSESGALTGKSVLDGVFTPDVLSIASYAGIAFLKAQDSVGETAYYGDNLGFIHQAYTGTSDSGLSITLEYVTPYINCQNPTLAKRFNKVVVYVVDTGIYNLSLDFWSDYRNSDDDKSSITTPISTFQNTVSGVWDQALWDTGKWDAVSTRVKPVIFNLNGIRNNLEGDVIRLRLRQTGTTETVHIHGFSIYYTELNARK